ncbi:hypothetical protein BGX33_007514 [Mortierella sp. NVP41]|nr:hypothetical protein BGX33_007514 [Mortierella sp. NVP41]
MLVVKLFKSSITPSISSDLRAHALQAVHRISDPAPQWLEKGRTAATLFVGTRSIVIYHISISAGSAVTVHELFSLKEPIAALLIVPSQSPASVQRLLVVGERGTVSWTEILDQDSAPVVTTPKTLSLEVDIRSAFIIQAHLYLLTAKGRVLRAPLATIGSMNTKDLEIMDLPPLCALVPIPSIHAHAGETNLDGFYGLNQQGQLLRFSAEYAQYARPQGVVEARESVGKALLELERLSDQVKQLEIQCQQSVMSSTARRGDNESEDVDVEQASLLIETCLTTFSHVVSGGYEGSKRFYARLSIRSRANIDWSQGWSVAVNMASKVESCPHGKIIHGQNSRTHHQTFANLRTLTRQTPWTLDIELDRQMLKSLPLQVSIGLQFRELCDSRTTVSPEGEVEDGFGAYFVVDSLELDALHFVEAVEDPAKQSLPALLHMGLSTTAITSTSAATTTTTPMQVDHPRFNATITTSDRDHKDKDRKGKEHEGCMQCKVEKGNTSVNALLPIEFEIDTVLINLQQCLPALLGDGRMVAVASASVVAGLTAMVAAWGGGGGGGLAQSCFRACFTLPDECLTSAIGFVSEMQGHGNTNAIRNRVGTWGRNGILTAVGGGGGSGHIENPDAKIVWVDLEEVPIATTAAGGGLGVGGQRQQQQQQQQQGTTVRVRVSVRGSDLTRVQVVRRALEKRIRALFD